MWLSILIVAALVGGLALSLGGAGIFGIPLLAAGLLGLGAVLAQRGAKSKDTSGGRTPAVADDPSVPQDTGNSGRFRKTGVAHPGQERMIP